MNNLSNDPTGEPIGLPSTQEDCITVASSFSKDSVLGTMLKDAVFSRTVLGHSALLASILLGVISHLLLKFGILQIATSPGILGLYLWIVLGLAIYALATGCWMVCLSCFDLSYAYPFTGLSYVLIFIASWLLFGDSISFQRFGGILLICLGLVFISKGEHGQT
ncbi:MAG TPA: hypothetical protein VGW77_30790 [Candidatus Binatia bacterium]|jgi:multidrug transporter EmrE-like cation transporter|nr:hypothetical protein [Candidatus Binatia bacterium]